MEDSASAELLIKRNGSLTFSHIFKKKKKKRQLWLLLHGIWNLIEKVYKLSVCRQMLCSVLTGVYKGRHESSNEGTQDS